MLMGGACISTMKTAIPDDFPFVFGGDGASLLLPDRDLETACDRLSRLQNFACFCMKTKSMRPSLAKWRSMFDDCLRKIFSNAFGEVAARY